MPTQSFDVLFKEYIKDPERRKGVEKFAKELEKSIKPVGTPEEEEKLMRELEGNADATS